MDFYSDYDYNNTEIPPLMYYDQYSLQNFPNAAQRTLNNCYGGGGLHMKKKMNKQKRAEILKKKEKIREKYKNIKRIKSRNMMLSIMLIIATCALVYQL